MALFEVALLDLVVGEEMKLGMEFYIHYTKTRLVI